MQSENTPNPTTEIPSIIPLNKLYKQKEAFEDSCTLHHYPLPSGSVCCVSVYGHALCISVTVCMLNKQDGSQPTHYVQYINYSGHKNIGNNY